MKVVLREERRVWLWDRYTERVSHSKLGREAFGVTQHDNSYMFKLYVACAATMYLAAEDTNVTRS